MYRVGPLAREYLRLLETPLAEAERKVFKNLAAMSVS